MQIVLPSIEGSGIIYLDILKSICGDTSGKSMIDLMCHKAPYTSQLGFRERTYVDVQNRGLDNKEEEKYFIESDVFDYYSNNMDRKWDVSICSDGIEHLSKQEGITLSVIMTFRSKTSIIFTPLGDCNVTNNMHPDSHRSGWQPSEFRGWGTIVLPNFHPQLNMGAFFAFYCENIKEEFKRIKKEINKYKWTK